MTCEAFEVLLCDYLDNTLSPPMRSEVEQHMAGCAACAELAQDAGAAVAFIQTAESVEPPPELITRIVVQTRAEVPRPTWWRRTFGSFLDPILQPKFAMSMALTILSFSMVAKLAGIPVQQLRPSDMDPVRVWTQLDVRVHHAWERVVKYYEGLRVVYEVQTHLKDWTEQEQEDQGQSSAPRQTTGVENKTGGAAQPPQQK